MSGEQAQFFEIADRLTRALRGDEVLLLALNAEQSDFVRFNHAKVRQAGSVQQSELSVRLVNGRKQAVANVQIANTPQDIDLLSRTIIDLRAILVDIPDDPYLDYAREVNHTQVQRAGSAPSGEQIAEHVATHARELDLVGIYAGGKTYRGFANSLGQRNWDEGASFNFEWSVYAHGDKAVKSGYAGTAWDAAQFEQKLEHSAQQFALMRKPARRIAPGEYRAYLAPRALDELLGLLSWGGFSAKARAVKRSPLLRMQEGARLSAAVTLREHTAAGVAPAFGADGYVKPASVTLIEQGALGEALVSARSAREYGLTCNGAGGAEQPHSLDLAPGTLPRADALQALDTGLYISNLWYLNFSDRAAARCTGMTRFATFWVERGEIVAPIEVMRFDDSIYRMLGTHLLALTREREFLLDAGTYGERSLASAHLPGALIEGLNFTL